ncbi:MAG: cysteine desulfurase [Ruminococcaceae bacterium]|nr:cysteine desulfurase [Oscillospiraceae bacterium]
MSIYLDNSATTKICPEALKKYIEVSESTFGNPSSLHGMGVNAEKELDIARNEIQNSLKDRTCEIVFTSSGSEANNLAIFGRAFSKERYKRGAKIITTDSEHASVSSPVEKLAEMGFKIARVPTKSGIVDLEALEKEMTPDVILVTVMMVNNETGALYDIPSISNIMRANSPDAFLHVDATQSYLKIPFTRKSLGADMITVSSHKIEGPKGVGALVIAPEVIKTRGLSPIVFGGGQEKGLRSGTENVPGIAAFGEAIRQGLPNISANMEKTEALRSYLIEKIVSDEVLSAISITNPASHAPHIINLTLPSVRSETMLHYLSSLGIYVSSGSACSSNSNSISSALTSFGRSAQEADSSIRVSFSHRNDFSDVDALADALKSGIQRLARVKK